MTTTIQQMPVPRGVVKVTDEERVRKPPLPESVTPAWLEQRMREFANSVQLDLVAVVDAIVKHRLSQGSTYAKPILSIAEAAEMLGVSTKRLKNIIYEERARLGHMPDFICDANGVIQQRIVTDRFVDWVKKRQRRRPGRTYRTQGR